MSYENNSHVQFWKEENGEMVKADNPMNKIFMEFIERIKVHEYELSINYSIHKIDCYIGRLGGKYGEFAGMFSNDGNLSEDAIKEHNKNIYNDIMEGKYSDLPYKDREFWDIIKNLKDEKGQSFVINEPETIERIRKDFHPTRYKDNYDIDKTVIIY